MPDFRRARVALLEARLADQTAAMVRRLGGEPMSVPAVREVVQPLPDLEDVIVRLASAPDPLVVCLTGAGVHALFAYAVGQGLEPALTRALAGATTVCRGPKPAGARGARALPVSIRAAAPFTTGEVIDAVALLALQGRVVAVVHHGERNAALVDYLRARGADVRELMPYEWRMPENPAPLDRLVELAVAGGVDAVAFTSQVQVKHLWERAGSNRTALRDALNRRVLTGAVGPTCAAALAANGVEPAVVASPPKLNVLLLALADACERMRAAHPLADPT